MAIRAFEDLIPTIANTAYIYEDATVIGDVHIGEHSSIWPGCILRGDINSIRIGNNTNLQDQTVIHVTHASKFHPEGFITSIGNNVVVGHRVILHGCTVADHCLIGMGAIIMDGAMLEPNVMIGAGSLVTPGKILRSGYLYLGQPVREVRKLTEEELAHMHYSADYYAKLKDRHQGASL